MRVVWCLNTKDTKISHEASAPRAVVNHLYGKLKKSTYRQGHKGNPPCPPLKRGELCVPLQKGGVVSAYTKGGVVRVND